MSDTDIEFELGEFAEGMPWKLVTNHEFNSTVEPCKHCVNIAPSRPEYRIDGTVWNSGHKTFTVPLSVHAASECGYNGTIVCLDCILEARAALDAKEREE